LKFYLILALLFSIAGCSEFFDDEKGRHDWRKSGSSKEQLKALVKIVPGTHHWMPEIAYRYQSM